MYATFILVSQFYVFDILSTLTYDQWTMFSPLSISTMVLLKPAYTTLSSQITEIVPFSHPYMAMWGKLVFMSFYQHFWSLHYYTVHLYLDGVSSWFSCFWKLLLRFVFTKNMFLPFRLYRDKNETQICNTNLGMLLRKGERKQQ